MYNLTWGKALSQAEHRVAIGETSVYLDKDDRTLDWSKCVGMETGGSHRLDIATSIVFIFRDKGIEGRWHFDIEPRSANGSGHYHIDVDGIQRILSLVPLFVRKKVHEYLGACAEAVEKQAKEYQEIASKEYGMAGALRRVAAEG